MLKITPADGSEAVYYTQPLEATHEVSFTISNGDGAATCQLIAAWGVPDVSKTANNTLLGSGATITVNGGAPADVTQPAQDQGNSDSAKPSANSNGGKDSTDSKASTNGDQKDTGASTATQKNDQETTGE